MKKFVYIWIQELNENGKKSPNSLDEDSRDDDDSSQESDDENLDKLARVRFQVGDEEAPNGENEGDAATQPTEEGSEQTGKTVTEQIQKKYRFSSYSTNYAPKLY